MQSSVSHTVWESHIPFPNPDAGRTQPLGIKLGLWDTQAVLLHVYYHAFFLRWHTNSSEHFFNKDLQKTRFRLFLEQDLQPQHGRLWSGSRPWAGGKDGPSHPRDSKLSIAERCVSVLPNLLHRHEYRTLNCCTYQHVFLCFRLKSRTWKAELCSSERERNRGRY